MNRSLVITIAITLMSGHARADRIVLESYGSLRPTEADSIMSRLRPMLDRHGFTADVSVIAKRLPNHTWLPGTGSPVFDGGRFAQDVASAINDYEEARFAEAAKALGESVRAARANPVLWVKEPKYRDAMMRCLLYNALALGRLALSARNEADRQNYERQRDESMTDLIRAYPSQIVDARHYGREASQLFDRMRKVIDGQGHGRLIVKVNDPQTIIYLDEVKQSQGAATIENLAIGTHRVLLDTKAGARQYLVTILPNQDTHLEVDWKLDGALVVKDWVGLLFTSDDDRAQEAAIVQRVAQRYTNADYVAIVTVSANLGKEQPVTVFGRLYEITTAKNVRGQQVELTGQNDDEQLEKFAAALQLPAQEETSLPAIPIPKQNVRGPIAPLMIALGGATAAGGVILYASSGSTDHGAAIGGIAMGLGGLGLVGGGIYLWISHRSQRPSTTAGVLPIRAGAMLTLTGPL